MSIEAMKLALEFVEANTYGGDDTHKLITTLRTAIEQAKKQEPVAWAMLHDNGDFIDAINLDEHARIEGDYTHPLYKSPPQRQPLTLEQLRKHWPLTLEQLRKHWQVAKVLDMTDDEIDFADYVLIARDVEALYGIKGEA